MTAAPKNRVERHYRVMWDQVTTVSIAVLLSLLLVASNWLPRLRTLMHVSAEDPRPLNVWANDQRAIVEARRHWIGTSRPGPSRANLLLDASGQLVSHTFQRLSQQRDDRRV